MIVGNNSLRNLKHLNTYSLEAYTNVDSIESSGTNYNVYNLVSNALNYLTNINIDSILWHNITQAIMEKLYSILLSFDKQYESKEGCGA